MTYAKLRANEKLGEVKKLAKKADDGALHLFCVCVCFLAPFYACRTRSGEPAPPAHRGWADSERSERSAAAFSQLHDGCRRIVGREQLLATTPFMGDCGTTSRSSVMETAFYLARCTAKILLALC